eukprot:scaffold165670_cov16-Prasinocladus_malaysianus.AAC.1
MAPAAALWTVPLLKVPICGSARSQSPDCIGAACLPWNATDAVEQSSDIPVTLNLRRIHCKRCQFASKVAAGGCPRRKTGLLLL